MINHQLMCLLAKVSKKVSVNESTVLLDDPDIQSLGLNTYMLGAVYE